MRVEFRSELAAHPAARQTASNIAPLSRTAPGRRTGLIRPFMGRTTRQAVDSFQRFGVTNLTNRQASSFVLSVKASYRGFQR